MPSLKTILLFAVCSVVSFAATDPLRSSLGGRMG
jgi:hypothetical protein